MSSLLSSVSVIIVNIKWKSVENLQKKQNLKKKLSQNLCNNEKIKCWNLANVSTLIIMCSLSAEIVRNSLFILARVA